MFFCRFFNINSLLFLFSFFIGFLFCFQEARAQNLFPNPDFEVFDNCPDGFGQVTRLRNWDSQGGSPDYFNCDYYGNQVNGKASKGNGVIGFWGGAQHPACGNNGYAEYVSANLLEKLAPGTQYTLSFDSQINGVSGISGPPSSCMDVGFYFYRSNTTTIPDQFCCYNFNPQVVISASEIQMDKFKTFQFDFIAEEAFDKVVIGPYCNENTATNACDDYFSQRMYFNLDGLQLSENPVLDGHDQQEGELLSIFQKEENQSEPIVKKDNENWVIELKNNGVLTISIFDVIGRQLMIKRQFLQIGRHRLPTNSTGPGHLMVLQYFDEEGNSWRKVLR